MQFSVLMLVGYMAGKEFPKNFRETNAQHFRLTTYIIQRHDI